MQASIEHTKTTVYMWTGMMHIECTQLDGGVWDFDIDEAPMNVYKEEGMIVEHRINLGKYDIFHTKTMDKVCTGMLAMLDCSCCWALGSFGDTMDRFLSEIEFDISHVVDRLT